MQNSTEQDAAIILARIDERLKNIENISKIIYGNGRKGLLERVQELEDYHKNENGFLRRYGNLIAWLVATALALYSTIKHH